MRLSIDFRPPLEDNAINKLPPDVIGSATPTSCADRASTQIHFALAFQWDRSIGGNQSQRSVPRKDLDDKP